jgi:DNA-binding response OmpR family regulator
MLVALNNDDMATLVVSVLREQGYEARAACADALRLLESRPDDVLIADLYLKPIEGTELCRRAAAIQPALRFLVLSSNAVALSTARACGLAAPRKPFGVEELVAAVARVARSPERCPGQR